MISLIVLIILLLLGLLVAAGYYTAGGSRLFDKPDGSLHAGAGTPVKMQVKIQVAKARAEAEETEMEAEEEEEKLPEVDPALRLPNTVDFAALWEQKMPMHGLRFLGHWWTIRFCSILRMTSII